MKVMKGFLLLTVNWKSLTILTPNNIIDQSKRQNCILLEKTDLCFSSEIKEDTDPCWNQYCPHSFQYVLWTLLAHEWLFSKGAPIVLFNLCPTVYWKPLFTYSAMNVSVRVGEYVWSAHSPPIQLKRHDNIPQRAPLENTVMQIASSDTFPAVNKEGSPKVSTFRRQKHQENHWARWLLTYPHHFVISRRLLSSEKWFYVLNVLQWYLHSLS